MGDGTILSDEDINLIKKYKKGPSYIKPVLENEKKVLEELVADKLAERLSYKGSYWYVLKDDAFKAASLEKALRNIFVLALYIVVFNRPRNPSSKIYMSYSRYQLWKI